MTTKINKIWRELENDNSYSQGLLLRRYSGTILPDVYVAVQHPEKLLCVCVLINKSIDINISLFSNLQEIKIELLPTPNQPTKNTLIFKLLNNQHRDIFAVLCEDLFVSIERETNEKKLVKEILNRFEKWKSLFNKLSANGLTPEEQRGLFGELYFLRQFLKINSNYLELLDTWIGTEKQVRDFQYKNWAVEVKTTFGNNHQKIQINSERQLDITNLELLYLYHVSLEQLQQSGETLNQIVNSILEILKSDILNINKFKNKLYEVGYFETQSIIYERIGYSIRQDNFYKIENDFPRIQENEIRAGVGDVKYSIILSNVQQFIQIKQLVFNNLTL